MDGLYPYSVTCSKTIPYRDFMSRTVKKLKLTILIMATQCMTLCFLVNFAGSYYKTLRISKIICSRIGTILQSYRYTASNYKLKQETFLCMDKGSLHGSDILVGFISCVEWVDYVFRMKCLAPRQNDSLLWDKVGIKMLEGFQFKLKRPWFKPYLKLQICSAILLLKQWSMSTSWSHCILYCGL